jgi:acetoacetate decarboxylase
LNRGGGILRYGPVTVALATMGYKHRALPHDKILASLSEPNFLLKIIPHVDGTPRICELVRYFCEDITVKDAWEGPGSTTFAVAADVIVSQDASKAGAPAAFSIAFAQ